jgi:hypothetical protein
MTEADVKKALEEATLLAERFPDIPDADVIEHVEHVCMIKVHEGSILAYTVLNAFHSGNANTRLLG